MESGGQREIVLRVLSAATLAALALGAAFYSPWTFLALVVAGGGVVAWEWGRLTRGTDFDATALIAAASTAVLAISVAMNRAGYGFLLLGAAAAAIWLLARHEFQPPLGDRRPPLCRASGLGPGMASRR